MSTAEVLVLLGGTILIAGELWFFLGPRPRAARSRPSATAPQEATVHVRGGYEPDTITVEAGREVILHFYRDETSPCSEKIVFDSLGIERELPAFETTTINFTPRTPGDYSFRCGQSVLKGRVVARPVGSLEFEPQGHEKHE